MRALFRWLNLIVIIAVWLSAANITVAQDGGEEAFIAGLIPRLSPEAKVGQLFVVSFSGNDVSSSSDVADLIVNYRVGGVVLSTGQGNILNDANTPTQVAALTAALQDLSRQTARTNNIPFIPLYLALQQDGDGAPNSEISAGLTPAPSYMAIGATWNPADAEGVGKLVGQELSALGINLLIGPSLDVRTQPSTSTFDPGVNVFGSDPYWVGVMGQAYVRGLRSGSNDRLAAILRHFPGQGSLDDDSYTIDRSLDDLKKIDLMPFFRLMQLPPGKARPLADAVLTTNVRYRGFSGNIRERTRPISIDSDALQALLGLPEVKAWRDAGGLMIGDALGSSMVRGYYSMTASSSISITQAALESFQAGNDVLILRNLSDNAAEEASATREVIHFFRQKYSTDPTFQARVDSAVQRILRLKYRLYPNYDFAKVVVPFTDPKVVGGGGAMTQQTANDALTLLYPAPDKLTAAQPQPEDVFLIATDDRVIQDCRTCVPRVTLGSEQLGQAISRAYGVATENITSTTFSELKAFVTGVQGARDLAPDFERANWIVFAMQSLDPNVPFADAVRELIARRPDLLTGKRVVGFIFGPPQGYTLSEMSRFTALYAEYSKTRAFIDVAVRALSGEATLRGRSPINLEALGYDLTSQTEPDPNQVIQLFIGEEAVEGQPTPAPPNLHVGDSMKLRTSTVLDRNGHPVPDGTLVRFNFQYDGDTAPTTQDAVTQNGVAKTEYVLNKTGRLLIRATSEPALSSITLQITISEGGAIVATLIPTPTPTVTPLPTATRTPRPTLTVTPTPVPSFMETLLREKPKHAQWSELLLALIGSALIGSGSYWYMRRQNGRDDVFHALRVGLWSAMGGLIAYVLFGLGLPGAAWLRLTFGAWAAMLVAILGGAIPLIYLWRKQT